MVVVVLLPLATTADVPVKVPAAAAVELPSATAVVIVLIPFTTTADVPVEVATAAAVPSIVQSAAVALPPAPATVVTMVCAHGEPQETPKHAHLKNTAIKLQGNTNGNEPCRTPQHTIK